MRGVNKAIIVGTMGQDPEVRHNQAGNAMANLSLATNESWKDKQTGEKKERTEWHRVSMFGRLAEIAGEYLSKGSHLYIEGQIRTRKWTDQQGQDRYTTEVVAREMQMLGGGQQQGAPQRQAPPQQQPAQQQPPQQQRQAPPPQQQPPQQQPPFDEFGDFDDDIPF